ncbi:hypothetical protein UK23_19490 [Lentzea aerocolonigenes]|uniref:ABC transporter substrate-binding protein n=1 Tax=Lentzea aerocolonigenes TaxID=68170 RepID=A0A0F0H0E3_LENAE|nr:DUF2076 family protein [Lentzea aerocolonigenes]KJK47737.1 hypothetical protein UK23_19490 [Lentzea aerocolonigenes]
MDHQDRELILGLANRLRQAPPVLQDREAAELIAQQIACQPNAVYLLVQAVLLQEEALRQAQARSGATGTAQANAGFAPNPAFAPQPGYGTNAGYAQNPAFANPAFTQQHSGYGHDPHTGPGARGGFMKTAAAAAAGVAGGALLVAGANELFSDNQPQANQAQSQESGEDEGGFSFDLF